MKNLLSTLMILLSSVSLSAQKTIKRNIYFDNAQSQLSAESQTYLRALSDTIKKYPFYSIIVKGFTDSKGTESENKAISQKRAAAVQNELTINGITADKIKIQALSMEQSIGDNTTEEGRKMNRRAEISITIYQSAPSVSNTSLTKKYQNLNDLYRDLAIKFQSFKINTAKDTIISGDKGTILFIPKNAFAGVPSNAIVDVRLKEVYSFGDILSENLTTHAGTSLLQTGGMIYIDAQLNTRQLTLQRQINVSFASKESNQEGMQLFSGRRDAKNNIDWIPADNQGQEEEVTIYRTAHGGYSDVLSDKDGYIKFKDIIDTLGCFNLFRNKKTTQELDKIDLNKLNKTQLSMVFKVRANPILLENTFERIHYLTFKETYDFYEVTTFQNLSKKGGYSWDSLMAVRMDFMGKVAVSQEEYKARQERLIRQQDSLKKEYELWYAIHRDSIEAARKKQLEFNQTFQLNTLGWFNCDRYMNSELANMKMELPSSEMYNIIFILKKEKMAIQSWAEDNKVVIRAPINKNGTLVGMKLINGEPYLGMANVNVTSSFFDIQYKKTTVDEIKEQFKLLNK